MGKRVLLGLVLGVIASSGLWSCISPSGPPDQPVETILFNGKVVTVDPEFSYAQALAIADGKIVAVGSSDEIQSLANLDTRRIDLQGKTVIPGMADNHFHSAGGGPGVDLSRVRTMEELLEAIAERVEQSDPDEVIITNSDWHEGQLKEHRLPLRWDLDKVASKSPVVVIRGGHEYILNSAALKKWNITRDTPVPEGGRISRYGDGRLNGELVDRAKALVKLPPPPAKDLETRIQDELGKHQKLHAAGLTSIRYPGAPIDQYRLLQEIKQRGQLTMRVNFLMRLRSVKNRDEVIEAVSSWNVEPDEGDEWLRIGGVKLGVDGGFEGAWMREPYGEPWGKEGTFYGLQTISQEAYTALVKQLAELGWRVATHAVGDAAIDQVLAGYEEANRQQSIVGQRWVIEHGFIPRSDHFERINQLGLVVSAQHHLYVAAPAMEKYWGRERANWVSPVRAYLDHNVMVSAGTDSPVTPYPPLWVIYHLVTRDTISAGVFGKDQRISREEALRTITLNNAYLMFEEDIKGSLEPGKLGDLVVLSEDIMTCPEENIRDLSVLMTMVNGEIVYQDDSFKF